MNTQNKDSKSLSTQTESDKSDIPLVLDWMGEGGYKEQRILDYDNS